MHVLERTTLIPQPIKLVWGYFSDPRNLDKMTPEFLKFEILNGGDESIFEGQVIDYRIQILPGVKQRWLTEITHCKKNAYFVDEQRIGPYRLWHHLHRFTETDQGVAMIDQVHYAMPFGPLGALARSLFVKRRLDALFNFRRAYLQRKFGAEPLMVNEKSVA